MKVKIRFYLLFLFSMLFFTARAQQFPDTSLVRLNEISFVSAFEQKIFLDLLSGQQPDFFNLFLCNDSSITPEIAKVYKAKLTEVIGKYNTDYYRQMSEKKKVQKIYASIHDAMLEKYTPLVPFSSVFTTKEYHCVSSSMFYALVFDALGIPYEVRVIPGHVYLVAYPATSYVTVETTDPLHGAIIYDQTFKAKYIDYLRGSKLISKEEYNTSDLETLFKKYFNAARSINLTKLASIQYVNLAMESAAELKHHEALKNQEKAWILNPDTANSYILLFALLNDYSSKDKSDIACARQLGRLIRFTGKGITTDEIIGEFAQITQKQLLYDGNDQRYDSSYQLIIANISDTALLNEISFLYNYERGRILCNNFEYEQAIPFTQRAFELKPRNSDAKNNFMLALNNSLSSLEPEERLLLVDLIAKEVPALLNDVLFSQLRLSMYLMMIDMSFFDKDPVKGENYMREFEVLYPERISKYQYLENDIARAYGTASSYYFRLGKTARTRSVLEKGLQYAPNSYDLKNRLNAVK
jgi:tetratricopeptide (TPR) repeat protein